MRFPPNVIVGSVKAQQRMTATETWENKKDICKRVLIKLILQCASGLQDCKCHKHL